MGRALYSTKYTVAVAAPEVVQPVADSPYAKWSRDSNYFDPDSDEFFIDAQYEAFVDPTALLSAQPAEQRSDSPLSEVSSGSSSEASDNEQQDVVEEEVDNPVTLMARLSRTDPDWANTLLRLGRAMDRHRASVDTAVNQPSTASPAPVEQTLDVVEDESATDTPTGSTTPMPIPFTSSNVIAPSEIPYGTPHSFQMTPPSPANVSPRLLSWGHARRGGGSLTNSGPRMSGSTIAPARIRVYGFAA